MRRILCLLLAWWIIIVAFVLASMVFPRTILGVPHLSLIRLFLPIALLASIVYILWSIYRVGTTRQKLK